MSLPKQVVDAAAEADRLQQELANAATPQQANPEPPEEAPPTPEQGSQLPPEPEPPKVPEPKQPDEEDTWRRRYLTLKGKFDAEVPRLSARLAQLETELEQAKAAPPKEEKPRQEAKPRQPAVTDKDVEAYGGDLVDLMRRVADEAAAQVREEYTGIVRELEDRNANLLQKLDGVADRQVVNDRQTYYRDLNELVPDYEAVNVDPAFIAWLAEADPLSGTPRQEYLNKAFQTFNVDTTAALFNAYKAGKTPPTPSKPPEAQERLVQPSTSRANTAPASDASKRTWTTAEVDQFYRDVTKGVYAGKDAERARIENEIDLALAEGRLTR